MQRRMEDRIRQLCEQAVGEEDPVQLRRILVDLRNTIHQHVERMRNKFATYPVGIERRDRKPTTDSNNT